MNVIIFIMWYVGDHLLILIDLYVTVCSFRLRLQTCLVTAYILHIYLDTREFFSGDILWFVIYMFQQQKSVNYKDFSPFVGVIVLF